MWTKPSPWVCSPAYTFGLPATTVDCAWNGSHSPQMFTPNAACQWSPGKPVAALAGRGGTSEDLVPLLVKTIARMPAMTTRASAV